MFTKGFQKIAIERVDVNKARGIVQGLNNGPIGFGQAMTNLGNEVKGLFGGSAPNVGKMGG